MIRLGFVGTGYVSGIHARSCARLSDVKLSAVYSRHEHSGMNFAKEFSIRRVYTDYDDMLEDKDIDAIVIGLPTPLHKEFTVRAARAGKHVLCEKPIALTIEDGEEMIRVAETNGVILMIAHVLRFWPEYSKAKSVIDKGVIGHIRSVATYRFSSTPEWSSDNWILDAKQSGGVPVDLLVHDIDFIQWMLGQSLSVKASGIVVNPGFVESVTAVLEYENAVTSAEAGYILSRGEMFRMGFRVVCKNGTVEYNNLSNPTLVMTLRGKPFTSDEIVDRDAYAVQMEYFCRCVLGRESPSYCPPKAALWALGTALEIKGDIIRSEESSRRGTKEA